MIAIYPVSGVKVGHASPGQGTISSGGVAGLPAGIEQAPQSYAGTKCNEWSARFRFRGPPYQKTTTETEKDVRQRAKRQEGHTFSAATRIP